MKHLRCVTVPIHSPFRILAMPSSKSKPVIPAVIALLTLMFSATALGSPIDDKHAALGGDKGVLGAATAPEGDCADHSGRYREFKNGVIYWHPSVGAFYVRSEIVTQWNATRREQGALGYPIADEQDLAISKEKEATHIRLARFQHGAIYWILEPNVKQKRTDYKQINYLDGDRVSIHADGCVQTGGVGDTWKRYVDPRGPNSGHLYHGLWIPPDKDDLVRLQGSVDQEWLYKDFKDDSITRATHLVLGYEDDGYGDNGYYAHDDGTGDQCKGVGSAQVWLTILSDRPRPN